jgi:CBS domain-containing protein
VATTSKLIALADELRVGALAQPPYCADPSRPLTDVLERATRNGFDFLPVRTAGRPITHVITRTVLEGLSDWSDLGDVMAPVTAEMLVSADAPALSVLDRLAQRSVLFTLGTTGVEGVDHDRRSQRADRAPARIWTRPRV